MFVNTGSRSERRLGRLVPGSPLGGFGGAMTARLWFASVPFLLLLGISAFLVLSASDAAQAEDNGPQQVAPVPDAPGQPRVAWGPTRSSVRIEFPANTHDGSQFIYSYGVHLSRLMGDGQWTDWAWATDVHLCPSGTCSALLPDLTESTRYQVRVFARARMGNEGQITYGPASQERSFTTRSSLDPDPPSNFRVEQVSDNRARVAWEAPSHVGEFPLSAFSVYARRWTGTDWTDWGWAAGTGADGRTAEPTGYYEGGTRSDFQPETRYQLRALAVNRNGTDDDTRRWSAPSEIVEITTTSPVASEQPSDESTDESVPTTVPTTGSRTTTAKSQAPTGGPPPPPKPPAPTGNPGGTNDPRRPSRRSPPATPGAATIPRRPSRRSPPATPGAPTIPDGQVAGAHRRPRGHQRRGRRRRVRHRHRHRHRHRPGFPPGPSVSTYRLVALDGERVQMGASRRRLRQHCLGRRAYGGQGRHTAAN